ncbi:DMT family transporter [Achromobacter deleyi]|nr:DMT family transporter [Achromobacter deleyi]
MVSTRAVADAVSPQTLAFLRYLVGVVFLALPALALARPRYTLRDAIAVSALGVLQFGVLIVLLNYALRVLPAATCALVFSSLPLFTMALAVACKREDFSVGKLSGLLIAVAGLMLLLGYAPAQPIENQGDGSLLAYAALVGATLIGAACSIMYRPYLRRYPVLPTSALAMCASVALLAAFCWLTDQPLGPVLSAGQWAHVLFIGFSSGVGYLCLLWALARAPASRVMAFQMLGPVTAAVIELIGSRQFPSWTFVISMALVFSGLFIAQRAARRSA